MEAEDVMRIIHRELQGKESVKTIYGVDLMMFKKEDLIQICEYVYRNPDMSGAHK